MAMKTYLRHRTSAEVIALAAEKGIEINTERFDEGGDHIVVTMPGPDGTPVKVLYNVFNGRFFCSQPGGAQFSSDNKLLDGQPWFDAMLDFFYVEYEPAPQLLKAAP